MKKMIGALVLTLSSLLVSAGCASSGAPSQPKRTQPATEGHDDTSGDASMQLNRTKPGTSELPIRHANVASPRTTRLA